MVCATLNPAPLSALVAWAAVSPTTFGTLAVVGACAITRFADVPGTWDVPPLGLWLITVPAVELEVCCWVIDPTLKPALTSVELAACWVSPVTSGTFTLALPEETTSVIDEPTGTGWPADGLESITSPDANWSLVCVIVRPTFGPTLASDLWACAAVWPTTDGTFTDAGPEDTVRLTVEPLSALAPGRDLGDHRLRRLPCSAAVTLIWKPSSWRIVRATGSCG